MNTFKSIAALIIFTVFANAVFAQKKVKDTYLHKKNYLVEVTMKGGKKTKIFSEEIGSICLLCLEAMIGNSL